MRQMRKSTADQTVEGMYIILSKISKGALPFFSLQVLQSMAIGSWYVIIYIERVEIEMRMENKRLIMQSVTHDTSPVGWPYPNACAQPYNPCRYQETMDSCVGLVAGLHNHGKADTCLVKYRLCNADEGQQGRNS